MIIPMKKLHVMVQKKDIVSALEALRELGSVHIEHQEPLIGYQLEERREEVEILERAIAILKAAKAEKGVAFEEAEAPDWTKLVNMTLELSSEIEQLSENVAKRRVLINQYKPWGSFDPKEIEALKERGIFIQFYAIAKDRRGEIPADVIVRVIYSAGGVDYCSVISKGAVSLPFERVDLPPVSLSEMLRLQDQEQEKIHDIQKRIGAYKKYLHSLERTLLERRDVLNFEEAQSGMREDEQLAVFKGYCPVHVCGAIERRAQEERWGILFENPVEGDQP